MITRIEATHYRCLERLDADLGEYRVLVGANGAGKTTSWTYPAFWLTFCSSGTSGLRSLLPFEADRHVPVVSRIWCLVTPGMHSVL